MCSDSQTDCGPITSITISALLHTIKPHIQNTNWEQKVGIGCRMRRQLCFSGGSEGEYGCLLCWELIVLGGQIMVIGLKPVFSYTLMQILITFIANYV